MAAAGWSTAWLLGRAAQAVAGDRQAPWIVGRASGITALLLLLLVVVMGLVAAHPWRSRLRRPSTASRIRVHVTLAVFALTFTALHVVVLATDSYAGVGWRGALLPLGASYRPVAVTLGVIGLYAGLLAGVTAALAGRLTVRWWWPVHRISLAVLVAVWAHGLLAGSDSRPLRVVYLAGAVIVLALGLSRYLATTPADRLAARTASTVPTTVPTTLLTDDRLTTLLTGRPTPRSLPATAAPRPEVTGGRVRGRHATSRRGLR
jgi:hypothetical protein